MQGCYTSKLKKAPVQFRICLDAHLPETTASSVFERQGTRPSMKFTPTRELGLGIPSFKQHTLALGRQATADAPKPFCGLQSRTAQSRGSKHPKYQGLTTSIEQLLMASGKPCAVARQLSGSKGAVAGGRLRTSTRRSRVFPPTSNCTDHKTDSYLVSYTSGKCYDCLITYSLRLKL